MPIPSELWPPVFMVAIFADRNAMIYNLDWGWNSNWCRSLAPPHVDVMMLWLIEWFKQGYWIFFFFSPFVGTLMNHDVSNLLLKRVWKMLILSLCSINIPQPTFKSIDLNLMLQLGLVDISLHELFYINMVLWFSFNEMACYCDPARRGSSFWL